MSFDLRTYLTHYPQQVAFGDNPAEVFDRYHTPDIVLTNDGVPLGRDQLLAHVAPARRRVDDVTVTVDETVAAGATLAARYVLAARMRQGHVITTEIYMFGELAADGRLCRVDQITRDISTRQPQGDPGDA